jgi:hypothetical protein
MGERFDSSANHHKQLPLFQELTATLESKTHDALDGVENIERISFWVNPDRGLLDEDLIIGDVVALYTESLSTIRQRLEDWFGVVEYQKAKLIDEETGYFICVISEAYKPEGWNTQPDDIDMPETFTLRFTTSFDKWLQDQSVME